MSASELRPLIIINSGAYVEAELAAEFGMLPPAFLPVGVGRLYELQAQMLAPMNGEIILTLPESFVVPAWDQARLDALGIAVLQTPDAYSLGAALLATLGQAGLEERALRLLHGDTLLWDLDLDRNDVIAVADGGDGYRWSYIEPSSNERVSRIHSPEQASPDLSLRVCGYFSFSSVRSLATALAIAGGDFFAALNLLLNTTHVEAVLPGRWLDFGHVQTFFRSRRIATTQRSFNHLAIGELHVRKSSEMAAGKLRNEARWLKEAPPAILPYCARLIDQGETKTGFFYETEYEYLPTLAELFVFGRLSQGSWGKIISSCSHFIDASTRCSDIQTPSGYLQALVVDKTAERLELIATDLGIDLDAPMTINGRAAPSLNNCLAQIEASLSGSRDVPAVMHGDFCFSNILYSFRMERIRLIDPRATTQSGEFSLYGDARYDLAKLMHSISGGYDLIISGHYTGRRIGMTEFSLTFPDDSDRRVLDEIVRGAAIAGVRLVSREIWAVMASLFLSMPPLHADRPDRQMAFIANALRLVLEMENLA